MSKIGLAVRPGVAEAKQLGLELIRWAEQNGHEVMLEAGTANDFGLGEGASREEVARSANPIVTLGGDGTLIGIAHHVSGHTPTMLGVNFGQLGFLTEISPAELFPVLENVIQGKAEMGHRRMLRSIVLRDGKEVFSMSAVNDVVVQKGTRDRLVSLDIVVEGDDIMRLRADGLIFATPTGSTAYSLAAGGSIVHPSLAVVLVTPICPHSLTNRPLILPLEMEPSVRVPEYPGEVFVSVDGQESFELNPGDEVKIAAAASEVCFVRSPSKRYFEILRDKLNWGISNQVG